MGQLLKSLSDCFQKYIHTKVVKRMESFRVRHVSDTRERRLLLPLSIDGVSSIALVHILNQHLRSQRERTGRIGYRLHILLLISDDTRSEDEEYRQRVQDDLKNKCYDHQISIVSLEDILRTEPFKDGIKRFAVNRYLTRNLSRTICADLRLLFERLAIINFARKDGSECILWPHSTTELARLILSETAKGNGAFVSQLIADRNSPYHALSFHYPMRDLLDKEIELFVNMISPKGGVINIKNNSHDDTKNTVDMTIDKVMLDYCISTEKSYPNIVANVVRTCGKLEVAADSTYSVRCMLCTALTRTIPYEFLHGPSDSLNSGIGMPLVDLCYGCARIIGDASGNIQPTSK